MDEETRYESIQDAQVEADEEDRAMNEDYEAQQQAIERNKSNDLAGMFNDIEMNLKTIAVTLQGQIEELRQRIQELEKEVWKKNEN